MTCFMLTCFMLRSGAYPESIWVPLSAVFTSLSGVYNVKLANITLANIMLAKVPYRAR